MKFISFQLLVTLSNIKVDYQWVLNEINCYQVIIAAHFLTVYMLQAAAKV